MRQLVCCSRSEHCSSARTASARISPSSRRARGPLRPTPPPDRRNRPDRVPASPKVLSPRRAASTSETGRRGSARLASDRRPAPAARRGGSTTRSARRDRRRSGTPRRAAPPAPRRVRSGKATRSDRIARNSSTAGRSAPTCAGSKCALASARTATPRARERAAEVDDQRAQRLGPDRQRAGKSSANGAGA